MTDEIWNRRTLYTVSGFLDALNGLLGVMRVRVRGEISSVETRGKTTYFSLKDSEDGSVLSCLIFQYRYRLSGVLLEAGTEVIVEGIPDIWRPSGRLSLKVDSLEFAGEGALQKAYEDLKRRLELEGVFAPERKKSFPDFPKRIALVTSAKSAALGDFLTNLGRRGFQVSLYDASVEGSRAVPELIRALRFFHRNAAQYDALVLIRGGGSMESLQAFNNESLVREVSESRLPTLCGIGHERDVSLAALVADAMVSTPTAAARALGESFDRAKARTDRYEYDMIRSFEFLLREKQRFTERQARNLSVSAQLLLRGIRKKETDFLRCVSRWAARLKDSRNSLVNTESELLRRFQSMNRLLRDKLVFFEEQLRLQNPERMLALGYGLVFRNGNMIRGVCDVQAGDRVTIRLADGILGAKIEEIEEKNGNRFD